MKDVTNARVVIVGAGFGGLRVAHRLRGAPVRVTVIDRHNYHTFIPLLYQVATAGLEPEEIAQPVRRILRDAANSRFRLATVTAVDLKRRLVISDGDSLTYDYLVLAAGSVTNFFGMESVAGATSALRELDDAESLRDRVLTALERAANEDDPARAAELMTIVIVGGGPTGVELAGALAELHRHALPRDFPELDLWAARIILLEAAGTLLPGMPAPMQREAKRQLLRMGVEVRLNTAVSNADEGGVTLKGGEQVAAGAIAWVAGMRASPLAEALPVERDAAGRLVVGESLQLPGYPQVYAIGDIAHVGHPNRPPHPMLAPVAIQQGNHVAANILRQIAGKAPRRFHYRDRGTMVTIGRSAAVARIYGLSLSGFVAWVIWLTVHLVWLIGFRNRALVLVNWAWNYATYDRAVRLIRRRR